MKKREKDLSLEYYNKETKNIEILSQEMQQELIRKYQEYGDRDSYNKIIEHTLPLSASIVRKYKNFDSTDYLDLVQVGNLGIISALETYDSTKGIPFYLYAGKVIDNNIRKQIRYDTNIIKSPYRINGIRSRYDNFIINYYKENGVYPSDEMIKKEFKITDNTLFKVKTVDNYRPVSINTIINEDDGISEGVELQDLIGVEDKEYLNFDKRIDTNITLKAVQNLLTPRNYYVAYYRIFADKIKTEEELGKELFISYQAIQRIEERYKEIIKLRYENEKERVLNNYSISQLEKMNLKPLSPSEICLLHSLKEKIDEDSYYFIYTRVVDRYREVDYYEKFIDNTPNEIKEKIDFYDDVIKDTFTPENLNNKLNQYTSKLKVNKIFELDILPNRKIEQNKKINKKIIL